MIFTTTQAAKALQCTSESLRLHRHKKGIGHEIVPGRTGWTFSDLELIKRAQGYRLKQYTVKYHVSQLRGPAIPGSMSIWAKSSVLAKSKANEWFWNAELKENPKRFGIPVKFVIDHVKEFKK